jgi:HD-like signal output (HDOD) protein/CheY-like chemotaxis protein
MLKRATTKVTAYNVLFVDDDENMLAGLQRMLRPLRHEWNMRFVNSGPAALEAMTEESFHAIVSDMRMPDMDGVQLLTEVSRHHPEMVRLILSGFSEAESIMRTVGPAHQFLAKPCPPDILIDVLRRSMALRQMLDSDAMRGLLAGIKHLPTPPETYFRLIKYLEDPNASFAGTAQIIERDVAMTAELLKLTNSAYFSLPTRITSPLQAIRVLGFEILRSLVMQVGIFQSFHGQAKEKALMEAVNRDSFRVAHIARRIAKLEGFELARVEECFCAGMLCSIGALVLLDCLPVAFAKVKARVHEGEDPIEAEMGEFGATQFQLGAYLLGLWGFKNTLVEAVAFADQPGSQPASRLDVSAVVHVARVLAGPFPGFTLGEVNDGAGRMPLDMGYLSQLGKQDRLGTWMIEARQVM